MGGTGGGGGGVVGQRGGEAAQGNAISRFGLSEVLARTVGEGVEKMVKQREG